MKIMKFILQKPKSFLTVCLPVIALLSACGSNEPKTLAGLSYEPEKETLEQTPAQPFERLSHEEVRQEYKALLDLFEEKELKEKIERRIADVHMMEGVQRQNTAKTDSGYYSEATKAYRDILAKYPNSPDNAEVLYQLSKAYDTESQQEEALESLTELTTRFPNYVNVAEAYFRLGDIHFSRQRYRESRHAYMKVIESGNKTLELNSHYQLGWSEYKLLEYRKSIDSFTYVLSSLLVGNGDINSLGKKEKPLVNDSISSISLALDKIGGAGEVVTIPALARQQYVWRIYDNLGEYYLKKELYEQSASTFRLYVNEYPYSVKAPDLSTKLIDTYILGGFARQSLVEKERYIDSYGLGSIYTSYQNGISPQIKSTLREYIDELASHFHSKGQLHQKALADLKTKKQQPDPERDQAIQTAAITAYDKAANLYTRFIDTFPNDERIDEVTFLKAEVLFSSYQYPEAIKEYEKVAYQPQRPDNKDNAVNAGYAAIISHEKQVDFLKAGVAYEGQSPQKPVVEDSRQVRQWRVSAVDSMLAFAEKFHTDERSPSVLTNAAEYLFSLNRYKDAIDVSSGLIAKNASLNKTLKKTAYGIIALSYFNLEDYQQAEDNYISQRNLVDPKAEEYTQVSERLAASIYKKSEVMISKDESLAAIDQLLRIKQLTPNSPIRVTAQYDAATLLLDAKLWQRAIVELLELKQFYPDYKYAVEYQRKLAFAYEQNEGWGNAASAYAVLVNDDPDANVRQEALFLTATMYERDKNLSAANLNYESYVQLYPQPFDNYMEAHYHLAANHEALDNQSTLNKWLSATIDVDQKAGVQRTDRSRWLGAWANAKYGDYYSSLFSKVELTLPIVKSVPNKNQWLQQASASYQSAADYGILEFVAMSSYKIGVLYRQFGNDLRSAPKPDSLSGEDQQIYGRIIDEQAAPFDQLAVDLHQANIDRAWGGKFNEWINNSFAEMRTLSPQRFNKVELIVSYGDGIF
jgi:tetratricopeptide (TPR) repeat protein